MRRDPADTRLLQRGPARLRQRLQKAAAQQRSRILSCIVHRRKRVWKRLRVEECHSHVDAALQDDGRFECSTCAESGDQGAAQRPPLLRRLSWRLPPLLHRRGAALLGQPAQMGALSDKHPVRHHQGAIDRQRFPLDLAAGRQKRPCVANQSSRLHSYMFLHHLDTNADRPAQRQDQRAAPLPLAQRPEGGDDARNNLAIRVAVLHQGAEKHGARASKPSVSTRGFGVVQNSESRGEQRFAPSLHGAGGNDPLRPGSAYGVAAANGVATAGRLVAPRDDASEGKDGKHGGGGARAEHRHARLRHAGAQGAHHSALVLWAAGAQGLDELNCSIVDWLA